MLFSFQDRKVVLDTPAIINKGGFQLVSNDMQDQRSQLAERHIHDRVVQRTRAGLTGTTRHHVYGTLGSLPVGPIAVSTPVALVENHALGQGIGGAVMPMQLERPLVGVTMPAQNEVHPI